jgi:hypothetical protein
LHAKLIKTTVDIPKNQLFFIDHPAIAPLLTRGLPTLFTLQSTRSALWETKA